MRVSTEKMIDHQYRENGVRNIYSNNNQMRAYVECSPNQSKKLYLIDLSIEQSTKLRGFQNSAVVQRIRVKIALNVVKASKLVQMKLIT